MTGFVVFLNIYIYIYIVWRERFTFIPELGFIFRTCEDGAGWHLIPYRISPRSEFFSQAYKNWHIRTGINLGLDRPPLARGSKFQHYPHTHQVAFLPPLDNGRYGPIGLVVIILYCSSRQLRFPVWYFKGIYRTISKQDNIRRIEAEKEGWSNKLVEDNANNNLDHVVTLKYMNLLLQSYTPSKCQIYNNWTVHEHKCLSSFLFFRFSSNWERERESGI